MSRGELCQCLERKMPKVKPGVRLLYIGDIERVPNGYRSATEADGPDWWEDIIPKLRSIGLQDFEIKLLTQRILHAQTFKEIVEEGGWTSIGSASHYFKETLKKLRERGFKL